MKIDVEELEAVLEIYSIEEILELNDLTVADALEFLLDNEIITSLPDPEPITVSQWDENILEAELLDGR